MEKGGEGFIDRSKVRILLCDNDSRESEQVFTLLCKCSYQVTSVRSPRQVIDALNAEGPDIDLILSEVDLPMSKGLKMLKYIMRDKHLRRIPVIMMSAQDEVSIVVKCLKFGAVDYLVKPLRTNELLNLWTHVWRRRRMLGLAEKNIWNYGFDVVVSEDPSDANTNSTALFSDDKSRRSVNLDACVSTHLEDEINANASTATTPVEIPATARSKCQPDVPRISDWRRGPISYIPKKSELKIGESSAFFTYIKSSVPKNNNQVAVSNNENVPQHSRIQEKFDTFVGGGEVDTDNQVNENGVSKENFVQSDEYPSSNSLPDSFSMERSYTPPLSLELSQIHMHPRNESHHDISGFRTHTPGGMNQVMMAPSPSPSPMYQNNIPDQHSHIPQCPPHMPGMAPFPYYPVSICLQPGQMPTLHPWLPSYGSSSFNGKVSKVDRREAALMKFRQKRKERCFDKKIRYVNRKSLAEQRPRVKGQFARKVNVDLNGLPASADDDEEDYEYGLLT